MAEIKVRDLTDTSSVTLDNKLMVLTNSTTNNVQNITIEDYITNLISTKANNVLTKGDDNKLYVETPESITGELSDLTTTDKTTLVNAINEVKGDAGNLADLSNLTEAGEERLHALKAYSDNGELLTDAEGLADVKNYAHSTFDVSKFTVTGSPNVTDDGIASGFSNSNYLTISYTYSDNVVNYVEKITFTTGNDITTRQPIRGINENVNKGIGITVQNEKINYRIGTGTTWNQANSIAISANTTYTVEFTQTSTTSTFKLYSQNGILLDTQNVTYTSLLYSKIVLGTNRIWSDYFTGTIDLKQLSITVDGVPVFSGNKTGLDTIKPDDYTVVGTPTISADGIASGFSNNDYITKGSLNIPISDAEIDFTLVTPSEIGVAYAMNFFASGNVTFYVDLTNAGNLYFRYWNGALSQKALATYVTPNTVYKCKAIIKNSNIYLYCNGGLIQTITDFVSRGNITTMNIGQSGTGNWGDGKIDLNFIKFYSNGNLVYQPCLKIPYTESKTGSKVVNSVYRDRVNDMAEQFGSANYYTLSDTDFTLPQVELYGLIGYKANKTECFNLIAPNYDNNTWISSTADAYTAPSDGYILFQGFLIEGTDFIQIKVNNNTVFDITAISGSDYMLPLLFPVCKNDEITFNMAPRLHYFIPAKGV